MYFVYRAGDPDPLQLVVGNVEEILEWVTNYPEDIYFEADLTTAEWRPRSYYRIIDGETLHVWHEGVQEHEVNRFARPGDNIQRECLRDESAWETIDWSVWE